MRKKIIRISSILLVFMLFFSHAASVFAYVYPVTGWSGNYTFYIGLKDESGEYLAKYSGSRPEITQDMPVNTGIFSVDCGWAGKSFRGTALPGTAGRYDVIFKDSGGGGSGDNVETIFTITIAPGPLTTVASDATIPLGQDFALRVHSTNSAGESIFATSLHAPTYTFSSSNTSVATIDANTGVITPVSRGTTTVTIDSAATESYQAAAQKTVTIAVRQADPAVALFGAAPSGAAGSVDAQIIIVEVTNAYNENINFTARINGIEKIASRSGNGIVNFNFTANELNALTIGSYPITVSSTATANNNAITTTEVGTLMVSAPVFVPVTNISGVATTGTAGTPVMLNGTVSPINATNQTITWSLGAGSTAPGAAVSGNQASATGAGTVVVTATIINGTGTGTTDFTRDFNITIEDVPDAPTNVQATADDGQATVTFDAPADNGGSSIMGYTVTSNPGNITKTGTGSPITVTGLTNGTAYTFTVIAANNVGNSSPSQPSNSVTPKAAFVPVTDITGVAATGTVGTPVMLSGTVGPVNATNQTITWSLGTGSTALGAAVSGNQASAAGAGTVVVTATVTNGAGTGTTDFTKDFTITFSDAPVASLSVQAPTFTPVTLGYSRPAAEPIIITNSGNADATNINVTVSDISLFELAGSGSTVTSGSALSTWTVQPCLGLSAGTHAAIITVEYDTNESATARVSFTVDEPVDAQMPTITAQPSNMTVTAGDSASFSVTASVTDGGGLTYQWYSNTTGSNTGGTSISGATDASYSPDTSTVGTYYYYVVVTNTNTAVSGSTTAAISSSAATLMVNSLSNGSSSGGSGGGRGSSTYNYTLNAGREYVEIDDNEPPLSVEPIHAAYINGYPDGTFRPDSSMTRAEAAALFYNLLGDTDVSGGSFMDVFSVAWYYDAVTALSGAGIINGYSDGSFGPDNTITRAEFVTMAMRFAGVSSTAGKAGFPDVDSAHWAAGYIAAATNGGYISGYPDGSFGPNNQITRAEAVTILNKIRGCASLDQGKSFTDLSASHWAYEAITAAATDHTHK